MLFAPRRLLVTALLSMGISHAAFAGAWTQDVGQGQFINQLTYFSSGHYYDRSGDTHKQATYNKLEYQPYVEYGVKPGITLGATTYIQRDWQRDNDNTGIADTELFLRGRVYHDNAQVVSLQPLVKLPSYFDHPDATPRGGSKSTDAELSLLYGHNWNIISPRDYSDLRIGYRARSHDLNDQYRADFALGLSPAPHWQVIPAVRYTKATSLGGSAAYSENGDLDYDLLKLETAVMYELDASQNLQVNLFEHVAGKQTGTGTGISVGYGVHF